VSAAFETPALVVQISSRWPPIARTCFAGAAAPSGVERSDANYREFDFISHLQFEE
jgi:hypothetical protein